MKYYKICKTVQSIMNRRGFIPMDDCLVTPYLQNEESFIEQFSENPSRSR